MTLSRSKLSILALAVSATALVACEQTVPYRNEVAQRIASPAWMVKRPIQTGEFTLTAFERMHTKNAPVNVYIEGDGTADRSSVFETRDPTPNNPVALHLAAVDKSDNVAYIARPCQFVDFTHYDHPVEKNEECLETFWEGKRFSPEVMTAYSNALDNIARQYGTNGFNLIGYDGGAAIAAILAAKRDDVLSLRTVAGNLDHNAQSVYLNLPPLSESLNAVDFAHELKHTPQHHFIGGQDETIKPAVTHSFLQALGETPCVEYTLVQEAEHARGWIDKWPELLRQNVPACSKPIPPKPAMDIPEPIYYPRMSGDKK